MTTNPISKRRQLGEAISFLRGETSMSRHNLADKTRTTVKIIEGWEAGKFPPSTQEWQRLRAIFPPLNAVGSQYIELFRAAAAEQLALEQAKPVEEQERDDLSAAVRLIIEAMPNLSSMTIEVDDAGEVAISYKTREVRVVEGGGQLKIGRTK